MSATTAAHTAVEVRPAAALRGELRLPGDKSISHRALMLALLADGESTIRGAGDGADVRSTAGIVAALGATVDRMPGGAGNVDYRVTSPGVGALRTPAATLDCGNSGTSLRLIAGILAGQPFPAVLDGDESLRGRPMGRVIEPLRVMGATISTGWRDQAPIGITGSSPLLAIDWATSVPSAQVKSSVLLAGLRATGTTRVRESVATRDHTERMLRARGVVVRSAPEGAVGRMVELDGGSVVQPLDEHVPGDPSAAAFWLVAGAIHRDAELRVAGVGVNPTRRAFIDLLRRMGASIEERPDDGVDGDAGPKGDEREPIADLVVRSSELHSIELSAEETAGAIDEIPALCLAAAVAKGRSIIRGAGELRHKESDRIAGIVSGLRALGAWIGVEDGNDIAIFGRPGALRGATVDSRGDHRLAMTFAIAGLVAKGTTTILGADSVSISYPWFFTDLERIRS